MGSQHACQDPAFPFSSGQVVKGGPPRGAPPTGRIEELFDSARRRGAQDGVADDLRGAPGFHNTGGFAAFAGRARTLAGDTPDTTNSAPAAPAAPAAPQPGPLTHVIVFYANGIFTVDDGAWLDAATHSIGS